MAIKSRDLVTALIDIYETRLPRMVRSFKAEAIVAELREVDTLTTKFQDALQAIGGDRHLTPEGQRAKRLETARATVADVGTWRQKKVGGLEARIATERQTLEREARARAGASAPTTDPVIAELRAQEIRAQLRGLDDATVTALYLGADEFTRQAIEQAPPSVKAARPGAQPMLQPLVDPKIVLQVTESRIRATNPEGADRLVELDEIRAAYASVAAHGMQLVKELTGVQEDELAAPGTLGTAAALVGEAR